MPLHANGPLVEKNVSAGLLIDTETAEVLEQNCALNEQISQKLTTATELGRQACGSQCGTEQLSCSSTDIRGTVGKGGINEYAVAIRIGCRTFDENTCPTTGVKVAYEHLLQDFSSIIVPSDTC